MIRSVEIGSVVLMGTIALACSTKQGGGGAGGTSAGGTTAKGGTIGSGVGGSGGVSASGGSSASGGTTSGGSGGSGRDAPGREDGSTVCGTQKWVQTDGPGDSPFLRLYGGPDRVFARTWDATNGGRTFLTSDSGATWTQIGSADTGTDILSVVTSSDQALAGTWNDLYQSDSGGASFSVAAPTGIPTDTAIWSLAAIDTALLAGSTDAVYRSSDNGASWTEVKAGIPANATVTCMVASENGILAGTDGSGVLALPSTGTDWQTGDSVIANAYINQLAVLGKRVFAVTPDGLFVSDDSGSTWTADTSGLPAVSCLLVLDGRLWAGTDASGVYVSTDTGSTWTAASAGMPDGIRVWSLAATREAILAGTDSGVWRVRCDK